MRWLFVLAAIIGAQCLAARVAAQTIIDPEATAVVRHNMQPHHGGMTVWKIFGERLEYQSNDGDPALVFEGEALWGGDRNKLWLKTEGEYDLTPRRSIRLNYRFFIRAPFAPFGMSRRAFAVTSPKA